MPYCNTQAMQLHLAEISRHVEPGAHAIVILDQAGWHTTEKLVAPANLTLVCLPPKCPELNPAENVWQFLRQRFLSNRVFRDYQHIVDACTDAWNALIEQPWRIMLIGLRKWCHAS